VGDPWLLRCIWLSWLPPHYAAHYAANINTKNIPFALAMGLWQRQGWMVPREYYPWTLAGAWGVVSAFKDAVKLEPPFRYMLTWSLWFAQKLVEGGSIMVAVFIMVLYMGCATGLVVVFMCKSAPARTMPR
jgi:hypothetical protein